MKYSSYLTLQIQTATNEFEEAIKQEMDFIVQMRPQRSETPLYSQEQVESIMAECERLVERLPSCQPIWLPRTREMLRGFLQWLRQDDYRTPEEKYKQGKRRQFREHIEAFASHLNSPDSLILDVAGRNGYASTVLGHLGFRRSYTIELSPINVILGRYVNGNPRVYQGDVHTLRHCSFDGIELGQGALVDAIFCRYSLEHFLHLNRIFQEFDFILKPGGFVYLVVGQTAIKSPRTGDIQAFPDAGSIYRHARTLAMVDYKLERNSETGQYQHFMVLLKPDALSCPMTPAQASEQQRLNRIHRRLFNRIKAAAGAHLRKTRHDHDKS